MSDFATNDLVWFKRGDLTLPATILAPLVGRDLYRIKLERRDGAIECDVTSRDIEARNPADRW